LSKDDWDRYEDDGWIKVDRAFADNEMRHRQIALKTNKWRVRAFYIGVRFCGIFQFNTM